MYMLYLLQPDGSLLAHKPSHLRSIFWNKVFPKLTLSCWLYEGEDSVSRFWDFQRLLIATRDWLHWNSIYCTWMSSIFFPPPVSIQISVLIKLQRGLCLQACQGLARCPKSVFQSSHMYMCDLVFIYFCLISILFKFCCIFERILVHINLWDEGGKSKHQKQWIMWINWNTPPASLAKYKEAGPTIVSYLLSSPLVPQYPFHTR